MNDRQMKNTEISEIKLIFTEIKFTWKRYFQPVDKNVKGVTWNC